MITQHQNEAISKGYDIIAGIFNRQNRIMPFDVCYGDGSRFTAAGLTRQGARVIWEEACNAIQ